MLIDKKNNIFQLFDTLKRNRTKRFREKMCFVESVKAIKLALDCGWNIQYLALNSDSQLSNWARDLAENTPKEKVVKLTSELFYELTDKESGSELFAIFKIKEQVLSKLELSDSFKIVVLDNPHSPGNLGTIIRTADAFSYQAVLTVGHSVDIYDPKCIRASLGTCFSIPCIALESPSEIASWINEHSLEVRILGTSAKASKTLEEQEFNGNWLIAFGNETNGLGKGMRPLCSDLVRIPASGSASSLNLSSAASIVLYAARS